MAIEEGGEEEGGGRLAGVLAGEDVAHSSAHYWYVLLEAVKVIALVTTGALLLSL